MAEKITIRPAVLADAPALSGVIIRTVRESNARDYPPAIIASVAEEFAPDRVAVRMARRLVLAACDGPEIIGTASLEAGRVRTVFVLPGWQGVGIGRRLMQEIERLAIAQGLSRLEVPASITAEQFYRTLGYVNLRDDYYGDERIIIMEKQL